MADSCCTRPHGRPHGRRAVLPSFLCVFVVGVVHFSQPVCELFATASMERLPAATNALAHHRIAPSDEARGSRVALGAQWGGGGKKAQAPKGPKQPQKKVTEEVAAQQAERLSKKKENVIELDGVVTTHSRNMFKVLLTNGMEVQATLAGKLRMSSIKVLEGDSVVVEMSPFDLTRGRITYRKLPPRDTEEKK
mmetsp:Transcript_23799/g.38157  ORF Transcript_23799/g.38157 Transcript_23799/m.38157 type:complete len:193 (+) Transcript_23799:64-642(+)